MKIEDLDRILNPNDYSWIKVKALKNDYDFDALQEHHKKETKFLIEKCREMAQNLKDLYSVILPK